jgi:hypothetical protein
LIEDPEPRIENIRDKLGHFQLYFFIYLLFFSTLLLHHVYLKTVKLQFSFFILMVYHSFIISENLKKIFDKNYRKTYPWQRVPIIMRLLENFLYLIANTFLILYIYFNE